MDLSNRIVSIDQLLLDPNNYRFIDADSYVPVEEKNVADNRVQLRTKSLLLGKGQENVRDLIASFKNNGFLDLEAIQVKALPDEKFLVLEGNRRMATLMYLHEQFLNNEDTGRITEETFQNISVKVIDGSDRLAHLVAMGLQHISGKKKWSPLNQAQMVEDLLVRYGMTEDEVCSSLGLSKQMLRRFERTLSLINAYKKSDYGDQFKSSMYSFFEETVKSPNMRQWLGWDEDTLSCTNVSNRDRLFSWFSEEIEVEEEEEDGQKTFTFNGSVIEKSSDIRILQQFISDEQALRRMEDYRSVSEGYAFSDYVKKQRTASAIENLERSVRDVLDNGQSFDRKNLSALKSMSQQLLKIVNDDVVLSRQMAQVYPWRVSSHFSEIDVRHYRGFRHLEIKGLKALNLFVGANNSGKTSLLEAIYLLTQLNDINRCIEVEKMRGKIDGTPSKDWLLYNFPDDYEIGGCFNSTPCQTKTRRLIDDSFTIDKQRYLATLTNSSTIGMRGAKYDSRINLYTGRENEFNYTQLMTLCRCAMTTPYRRDRKTLIEVHGRVVEMGKIGQLIKFLQENFDEGIESVELANIGGSMRFLVKSKYNAKPLELTKYGEGLQRIFEISLLTIYCADGCLLIDELDSAIHKNLLNQFVVFIQMLAKENNVQLFVTTHSKECVDAFAGNANPEELSAYQLNSKANEYQVVYSPGTELKTLIESFDFDIR